MPTWLGKPSSSSTSPAPKAAGALAALDPQGLRCQLRDPQRAACHLPLRQASSMGPKHHGNRNTQVLCVSWSSGQHLLRLFNES